MQSGNPNASRVAFRFVARFGSSQPLGEWDNTKISYRTKADSSGILVSVYSARKRIGGISAYDKRYPENNETPCDDDVRALVDRHPHLVTREWHRNDGAVWRQIPSLSVDKAFLDEAYHGKGIGKAMYAALMHEWFKKTGPYVFIPYYCTLGSGTSTMAKRVWDSMSRRFPSEGHAIAVLKSPRWLQGRRNVEAARWLQGRRNSQGRGITLARVGGLSPVKQRGNTTAPERKGVYAFIWPNVEPFLLGSTTPEGQTSRSSPSPAAEAMDNEIYEIEQQMAQIQQEQGRASTGHAWGAQKFEGSFGVEHRRLYKRWRRLQKQVGKLQGKPSRGEQYAQGKMKLRRFRYEGLLWARLNPGKHTLDERNGWYLVDAENLALVARRNMAGEMGEAVGQGMPFGYKRMFGRDMWEVFIPSHTGQIRASSAKYSTSFSEAIRIDPRGVKAVLDEFNKNLILKGLVTAFEDEGL